MNKRQQRLIEAAVPVATNDAELEAELRSLAKKDGVTVPSGAKARFHSSMNKQHPRQVELSWTVDDLKVELSLHLGYGSAGGTHLNVDLGRLGAEPFGSTADFQRVYKSLGKFLK